MMTAICTLLCATVAATDRASAGRITVEDLATFATIGDPETLEWNDKSRRSPGIFAPDRRHVVVLVTKGNVTRGANVATLFVYDAGELTRDRASAVLAEFSSTSKFQPIAHVKWLADGKTVVFAGAQEAGSPQIHSVGIDGQPLQQLTRLDQPLTWYDITLDAEHLLTLTELPRQPPSESTECRQRGCLVQAQRLSQYQNGQPPGSSRLAQLDLRSGETTWIDSPEQSDANIERCDDELTGGVSPNGRFALRLCSVRRMPDWWGEYTADPYLRICWQERNAFCLKQLMLIDLRKGTTTRVSSAPFRTFRTPPVWLDGGKRLLLAGVLEPLDNGADAATRARHAASWAVLLIDPETHHVQRVASLDRNVSRVIEATWDQGSQTLRVSAQDKNGATLPAESYRRRGNRWSAIRAPSPTAEKRSAPVELAIRQSLNERPMLVAIDTATGIERMLLDPNSWLAQRKLGRVEAIRWQSKSGDSWQGGLYYPPDYTSGRRYPLLLQTHGFDPDKFSLHGMTRNFPGQALGAHDVFVLQVADSGPQGGPTEWSAFQAGYEGAIDHLDELGLIDRARVGIIGWSRTGPRTGYTLTHSEYAFAAAAFTDSGDFGWWWYLSQGAPAELDSIYGGPPFGDGLRGWMQYAPSFNLDRVRTPMLMWEAHGVVGLWDWYAGLQRLRKPVEYWFLPDGAHDVFKIGERVHTNRLLVDWFRFWLKDEQDPDPAKAEQYVRWRKLREQQRASLAEPLRAIESSAPAGAPTR